MQKCVLDLVPGDIIHWDKEYNRRGCPDSYDIVLFIKETGNVCQVNVLYQDYVGRESIQSMYYLYVYEFQNNRQVDIL